MLYVCATPIGNLEDITLRVIRALSEVDIVFAEDTRHTLKLLNHLEIKTKLCSYHRHNCAQRDEYAISLLKEGKNVALVSDAGMPAISDPGVQLIKRCIENSLEFTILPGATAFVTALVASGLPTDNFTFIGFLPVKSGKRKKMLNNLQLLPHTLIFYESPHRVTKMLTDAKEVLGDRNCVAARELTKKFEEVLRGKISELLIHFSSHPPRGEFVILIEGA
ncbi:MAG: 16S rRNA (cytidine(1402)-2'-O)-methyltransferase [Clostridiales bacterium]|jgi:16S rRNA (cytidine1402-2'-O)-methyltransferase|nr:16S rRNA (cytidine(1402)-2'-O)-methyltransferase [Clostridiales bacterium]